MAIEMNEPVVKAPWPPQASNDPLYRYPKAYPIGQGTGRELLDDREEAQDRPTRPPQI